MFVPVERDFSMNTEFQPSHEGVSEVSERARERSAAERVSGVSDASERTYRATEWPFQNAIVTTRNRP